MRRLALLAFACAACPGERGPLPQPRCTATPRAPVTIDLRRCALEGEPGNVRAEWAAYVRNDGPATVGTLALESIARRADGTELGRDRVHVVGFSERLGWLFPAYGAQVRPLSMTNLRENPASIEITIDQLELERDADAATWTPVDVTWTAPPPPDVRFAIATRWCGSGVEGIGPSAGRVVFDCLLGVRNTGTAAAPPPFVELQFLDANGQRVDSLGATTTHELLLQPGDAVLYTAARGVSKYARMTIAATPSRAHAGMR